MGLVVKPNTFSSNTTALASEVNANFDTLYTLVNGNIEEANLANGAVTENKIAAGAVTTAKISATAEIAMSQLAALTASRAAVTDGSGLLSASVVTATELGHLSGLTGLPATATALTDHEGDTANPHSVTASQIGAAEILTELKTVDGAGSGLDADLIDGQSIYAGYVTSGGAALTLPSGWSVSTISTGRRRVTHNLGLAAAGDMPITLSVSSVLGHTVGYTLDTNSFDVFILDASNSADNAAFSFTAVHPQ